MPMGRKTQKERNFEKEEQRQKARYDAEVLEGVRCRGHCCKGFCLPNGGLKRVLEKAAREDPEPDAVLLAKILVPIGFYDKSPENGGVPVDRDIEGATEMLTCSELTAEGDCGIYEARPEMCQKYPNWGGVCQYDSCVGPKRKDGPWDLMLQARASVRVLRNARFRRAERLDRVGLTKELEKKLGFDDAR